VLRLFSALEADSVRNLWEVPHVLQQKFPADRFRATVKLQFVPNTKLEGEQAGLAVMGMSYASLSLRSSRNGISLVYAQCKDAAKGKSEQATELLKIKGQTVWLRVDVADSARCQFSYSFDGNTFTRVDALFTAEPGRWKGAKLGIFCTRRTQINDAGYADYDWFRVEPLP
jgi:beta-xylosidase